MPKRKVSRTQSSNTTTTKLFPEIATIAQTQATSRSISDFRQSSSMSNAQFLYLIRTKGRLRLVPFLKWCPLTVIAFSFFRYIWETC